MGSRGEIGGGADTGRVKKAFEMESDKEERRNAVCATDASQVMIVVSPNRRYAHLSERC